MFVFSKQPQSGALHTKWRIAAFAVTKLVLIDYSLSIVDAPAAPLFAHLTLAIDAGQPPLLVVTAAVLHLFHGARSKKKDKEMLLEILT